MATNYPLSYVEPQTPESQGLPGTPTNPGQEDHTRALLALLASLESQPAPVPPRIGPAQNIIGSLGDAISAMAAVRAGGAPPAMGPFAANARQQQMEYEKEARAAQAANIETRNKVRVGAFEEELRAQREKEVAQVRAGAGRRLVKSEFTRDVGGQPHTFQRWQDPQTGEIIATPDPQTGEMAYERDLGVRGYAPFIQPAIPGESPPTRIPRAGPPGPIGKTPPPPADVGEKAARLGGFARDIANFKKALPGFIAGQSGTIAGSKRLGQQIARKLPLVGPQISERISKQGELIAAARDAAMADFTRIMSGLQASEAEQARLARILPDLGTVDAETAIAKIDQFEQSVRAYATEIVHQRPHLLTPELKELLGLEGGAPTQSDPLLEELWGGGR